MKIALGTAQFGLDYGVSNRSGQVSPVELRNILDTAKGHGIDTLDTAAAYGNSEAALGQAGVEGFDVVTKLPSFPDNGEDPSGWAEKVVLNSLNELGVPRLSGLLFHRPMQLLENFGGSILEVVRSFQRQGVIQKIGVSLYSPEELKLLWDLLDIEMVQTPFNVFDQRLITSGWLETLKKNGVEIHARSVFLQGLLLMKASDRPAFFHAWQNHFDRYDRWVADHGVSHLEACLGVASGIEGIDRVVIGVQSARQLEEIVIACRNGPFLTGEHLAVDDEQLVNPARWCL